MSKLPAWLSDGDPGFHFVGIEAGTTISSFFQKVVLKHAENS